MREDGTRWLHARLKSNGSGNLRARIDPEYGETALLATFQVEEAGLQSHLRMLEVGPTTPYRAIDETADDNRNSRSSAAFVSSTTTLNWPIHEPDDGPLLPLEHTFSLGIVDASRQYTRGTARVGVFFKQDPDPNAGLLPINLVFGATTDPGVVEGVDRALQTWRDLYTNIGIQLDVQTYDVGHPILMAPGRGDAEIYTEIADSTRRGAVNVVVLESIEGFGSVLGFSGNIPGPLLATGQSAVVVSSTLAAGPDGVLSDAEVALLGETLAHEVGHFLGLYHPVEASFLAWDSLDDTPECSTQVRCETELGSNLMFPYPLDCAGSQGCRPQQEITDEQAMVANGYAGVL